MSRSLMSRSTVAALAVASMAVTAKAAPTLIYANNVDAGLVKGYAPADGTQAAYSLSNAQAVSALAADDAGKRLYVGFGGGGTISAPANNLYTYDYAGNLINSARTGNASLGGTGGGVSFNGFAFANGQLYGAHTNGTTAPGGIYTINPGTGSIALAGSLFSSGVAAYNLQDLDFDEANNRFIAVNTAVSGTGGSAAGLYSVVLPANPSGLATVTFLAGVPTDAPTGNAVPDGLAYDDAGGIVYLTYNRTGTISRYDLTNGAYLSALTGPTQASGGSGDAAFATGFVPEPAALAFLPALAMVLRRRRA